MAPRSRPTAAPDASTELGAGGDAPPDGPGDDAATSATEDSEGRASADSTPEGAGSGDDGDEGTTTEPPPELDPEPSTPEKVTARVMVSGLWGNRAGTKILQRDELVVVASDDSRLGVGKPLAKVEDQAADPDVAATLAALAGS